jgi:regulator of protease activity HflC (stomatin/prohibitin superfamily)
MNKYKLIALALLGVIAVSLTGCIRPVEPKTLIIAKPNETMFVIPLQGENKESQVQLNSAAYFQEKKVAMREYLIPMRWLNRGRHEWTQNGEWIPTVKVIIVDRTPVTRTFAVSDKVQGAKKDADAIWTESSDSVAFSMGWVITAMVTEEDSATFLYYYPASSLSQIVDTEVHDRIQMNASVFAAKWTLDNLRNKKNELLKFVQDEIIPFYKGRGITILNIGQTGGMTYENDDIQKSIDKVFVNQQEKENAKALLEAQRDINAKSEQATQQEKLNIQTLAQGKAEAIRLEAQAQAEAVRMKAEADAKGITMVNEATQKAQSNPLFLEIRKLEVEILKYNRWGGQVPTTLVEGDGKSGLNLFLTASPTTEQKTAVVSK